MALAIVFGAIPVRAKTDGLMVKGSSHIAPVQRSKKFKYFLFSKENKRSRKIKYIVRWPAHLSNRQVKYVIRKALIITKEPLSWQKPLIWLAFRESTNRPLATAWEGVGNEYAEGLMQMLPTTFKEHALPKYTDIWDPFDNTVAAIRYVAGRYRSPWDIPAIFTASYQGY